CTRTLSLALFLIAAPILSAHAEEAETSSVAHTPDVAERLSDLENKSEAQGESIGELKAIIEQVTKLKFSGYIQGRFEWHQDSKEGVNAAGKPTDTTQFLVRRGRLKTVYEGQMAEFVLQVDASSKGVSLKDAEATFIEPWTGLGWRLTAGQFNWPFGYESPTS